MLPVSQFTRDCRTGAPVAWCNACRRTKDRQYYRRHYRKMRANARRARLRNKAKGIVYRKSAEARRRKAARLMAFWAVRAGTLARPGRCERCGARPPRRLLHAHHPDYSKPLDVVWLCSTCHGREHWKMNGRTADRAPGPSAAV